MKKIFLLYIILVSNIFSSPNDYVIGFGSSKDNKNVSFDSKIMKKDDIGMFATINENITNVTSDYLSFSNTYSDDSSHDYLIIRTYIDVEKDLDYTLFGYLADENGQVFIRSETSFHALETKNEVELRFDLRQIKRCEKSGVFLLKGLELVSSMHRLSIGKYGELYKTKKYSLDDVKLNPNRFTGKNFFDRGIDINNNGLFEKIELNIELIVAKEGNYTIKTFAGLINANSNAQLISGKNSIKIELNLHDVVVSRQQKPLILDMLYLYDNNDNLLDNIDVIVQKEGEYKIFYEIQDENGNLITREEQYIELNKGKQHLHLNIGSAPFVKNKIDGPYLIRFFTIHDENHLAIDSLQNIFHKTKPYKYVDFKPF